MDRLPFFELEELLDSLKELAEREEEERRKQDKGSSAGFDMNAMTRQMKSSMPTMPNINF